MKWKSILIGFAGIGLSVLFIRSAAQAKEDSLASFFPAESQTAPWKLDGNFERYDASHLQDYLDGGADIYLEYGFRALGVQFYMNKDRRIQAEIFRMKSPGAALGAFSYRRHSPADTSLHVPNALSKYGILFQKGTYFGAITNMDGSPETAGALKRFAGIILQKIPGKTIRNNLLQKLQQKGLQPSTAMIIAGPLSMRVRWPIGKIHCFHFDKGTKAVTANYKSGRLKYTLFIVMPGKDAGFYKLADCFRNSLNAAVIEKSDKRIVLKMRNSKKILFLKKGTDVWIIPDLLNDLPVLKSPGEK